MDLNLFISERRTLTSALMEVILSSTLDSNKDLVFGHTLDSVLGSDITDCEQAELLE